MHAAFVQPSVPVLHIEGGVATLTLNRPAQRNRLENADLKHGGPAQAGVLLGL